MRTLIGPGSAAVVLVSLALSAACSGGTSESTVDGGGAAASGGTDTSNGASAGTLSLSGAVNAGGSSSGVGSTGSGGNVDGCAATTAKAELSPVYLVFLLDESGSMGDGENGKRAEKWDPVTSALRAFYSDPASAGILASLTVFPQNLNTTMGPADRSQPASCTTGDYEKPEVTPTALPDDKVFSAAMTKLDPPNEYGTPTYPALSGTIAYAQSLRKEDASRKVAIVMVTDGEPYGCQGNTVNATAMAAAQVADVVPTYVIGVGKELTSLNQIAEGGGTKKAFIVSLDNPAQTQKDLLEAIGSIRGQSISCELPLPAPPPGKQLDPDKVDVQFTGESQGATSLKYGTTCEGDVAWRYDDPSHPKKIELCDAACSTIKADPKAKLDVVFGCVGRVVQ